MRRTSTSPLREPTTEEWRPAIDPNYVVSDAGHIRRATRRTALVPTAGKKGYLRVRLGRRTMSVASIVAHSFLGSRPDGLEVNHKNGVKADNRASNLEYVSRSENMLHAFATGLKDPVKGEHNGQAKSTEMFIRVVRRAVAMGLGKKPLARMLGVNRTRIENAFRWWRHLDQPAAARVKAERLTEGASRQERRAK